MVVSAQPHLTGRLGEEPRFAQNGCPQLGCSTRELLQLFERE
jgi:hypothetical protein